MWVQPGINATAIPELCRSLPSVEVLSLKLDLNYTRPIYFLGIYRPPGQKVIDCIAVLDDLINGLYDRPNFELNVVGDLNINMLKARDPIHVDLKSSYQGMD